MYITGMVSFLSNLANGQRYLQPMCVQNVVTRRWRQISSRSVRLMSAVPWNLSTGRATVGVICWCFCKQPFYSLLYRFPFARLKIASDQFLIWDSYIKIVCSRKVLISLFSRNVCSTTITEFIYTSFYVFQVTVRASCKSKRVSSSYSCYSSCHSSFCIPYCISHTQVHFWLISAVKYL